MGLLLTRVNKSIIINGMADHVHILLGLNPKESISELTKEIKRCTSIFINDNKWYPGKFAWQEGYGAFSYGRSQLDIIYNYILKQKDHHVKKSFREEYLSLLKNFQIDYDEKYLFEFFD